MKNALSRQRLLFASLAGSAFLIYLTIALMIVLHAVHPPAVSTSLAFAFRAGDETSVVIFAFAVGITALLVGLQRAAVWSLERSVRRVAGRRTHAD